MMLMAETRPSSDGGVTDCRNVVVEITHRIGPAPSRKKLRPANSGVGTNVVSAITAAAAKPVTGPSPITGPKASAQHIRGDERPRAHPPGCHERANDHADAIHRERRADPGGR